MCIQEHTQTYTCVCVRPCMCVCTYVCMYKMNIRVCVCVCVYSKYSITPTNTLCACAVEIVSLIRLTYHQQEVLHYSAAHVLARAGLARSRNEEALAHTLPHQRHDHNEDHAHEPRTHVEERSPPKEVARLLGDLGNKNRIFLFYFWNIKENPR